MDWYEVAALLLVAIGASLMVGHAFGYVRGRDDEVARRKAAEARRG